MGVFDNNVPVDASGNVTVTGNLTVNGTTTTINSTTLTVDDKVVVIASGAADSSAADGAGISVDGASATILYDHTGTQWEMNKPLEVTGSISATTTAAIGTDTTVGTAGNTTAVAISTVTNTGTYVGKDLKISAGSTTTGGNNLNGGDLILESGGGDGTGTSTMQCLTKVGGTDAAAERMRIHTDGSVGIGTTSPNCMLHVAGAAAFSGPSETFVTFSDGDATPSVATGNLFKHHASTQSITMFDDGVAGQIITVISTAAITYDVTSTNLKGGSADIVTANGDVTQWCFDGTNWYLLQFMDVSADMSSVGGGGGGAVTANDGSLLIAAQCFT